MKTIRKVSIIMLPILLISLSTIWAQEYLINQAESRISLAVNNGEFVAFTGRSAIARIIREANKKMGTIVLMVTHDPDYASLADRQIHLADGRIINES